MSLSSPLLRRARRAAALAAISTAVLAPAANALTIDHLRVPSGGGSLAVTVQRPDDRTHPTVIVAPGLGSLYASNPAKFGARFANAGYTVVGFDYRYFGDSTGTPRRLVDPNQQLADWRSVIAALPKIPGADPSQVALWGSSMAGGHVLSLGPEYPKLKAVLAQVPHLDASIAAKQRTSAQILQLAQKITADLANAAFGLPPVTIPFIGAPGSTAMMTAPGALEYYNSTLNVPGSDYVNSTPARSALNVLGYSPIKVAAKSTVPTFIAAATDDQLAPAAPARELAAKMGATYLEVPGSHFDVYSDPDFTTIVDAEIAFLHKHMPVDCTVAG